MLILRGTKAIFILAPIINGVMSCISVDLPEHRYCIVKNGDFSKATSELNGDLIYTDAHTHYDPILVPIWTDDSGRLRRECLEKNMIPVLMVKYGFDYWSCVESSEAPQGCVDLQKTGKIERN